MKTPILNFDVLEMILLKLNDIRTLVNYCRINKDLLYYCKKKFFVKVLNNNNIYFDTEIEYINFVKLILFFDKFFEFTDKELYKFIKNDNGKIFTKDQKYYLEKYSTSFGIIYINLHKIKEVKNIRQEEVNILKKFHDKISKKFKYIINLLALNLQQLESSNIVLQPDYSLFIKNSFKKN